MVLINKNSILNMDFDDLDNTLIKTRKIGSKHIALPSTKVPGQGYPLLSFVSTSAAIIGKFKKLFNR